MEGGLIQTHYRSRNGRVTRIADMHDAHLVNAVAAAHGDAATMAALRTELATRGGKPAVAGMKMIPAAEAYRQVFGGR